MNIKELKEYIKDLPDDMEIIHWCYEWWFKIDKIEVTNTIDLY